MKHKKKDQIAKPGGAELLGRFFTDSEEFFSVMVQAFPDGIAITDLDGMILFANTKLYKMMEITSETEVIGTSVLEWIDPCDHEKANEHIQSAYGGITGNDNEFLLLKKNGNKIVGAINSAPLLDKTRKPFGVISIIRDISDNKQIEDDLRQKESHYRLLFESAHDSIFLMDEEVFVDCNPKTLEVFGCKREDIIGKSPVLFSPPEQADGSSSTQKAMKKIQAALDGESQFFEWKHMKLNEEVFDAEVSLNRLTLQNKPYLQAIVRNVSKRKKSEDQLRKFSECLLSFGTDPEQNINFLTALCGEILDASSALYNRLNENVFCPLGKWNVPDDYVAGDSPEGHICHDVVSQGSQEIKVVRNLPETSYYHTDPNIKKYNILTYIGKAVRMSGKSIGTLCAIFRQDFTPDTADKYLISLITSAIGVEEERRIAQNELLAKAEELKELNLTKDKFFSIIAHDLKGPFNAIMGFSEILTREWDDFSEEEKLHFIRNIHSSAKNTYQLLENLLEWSISQTGRLKFSQAPLDLSVLANEVVILLREMAERKQIKLFTAVNFGTVVFADENMVRTILRNLVSNAIKFTYPGGLVKIFAKAIPGTPGTADLFEVCVDDNGIGIPENILPRLFRIDDQVRTMGTSQEKGTGLGLVLCKELVEKNGGKIYAKSQPGKGSSFCFTLPAFLE